MVSFTTRFHQQLMFIFMILLARGNFFSQARQVKEVETVTKLTDEKEFAVEGDSNLSFLKGAPEAVPKADAVETLAKIGGNMITEEIKRKTSKEEMRIPQGQNNSKKVTMEAHSVENRKIKGEESLKLEYFMAFSADYRSPKPHPPKNN